MSTTSMGVGGVEMSHVTKRFVTPAGAAMTAIRDINLVVEPGQFCAIVGPTGCGKSTTLTLAAGLELPSAGTVKVSGEPVQGNGYAQAKELLPTDWLTSIQALERSGWARDAFGAEFLKVFLAVKRAEYRQFMGEVGEQDWRWYLSNA